MAERKYKMPDKKMNLYKQACLFSEFSFLNSKSAAEVIDSLNHHGFPRIGSELEIAKQEAQVHLPRSPWLSWEVPILFKAFLRGSYLFLRPFKGFLSFFKAF